MNQPTRNTKKMSKLIAKGSTMLKILQEVNYDRGVEHMLTKTQTHPGLMTQEHIKWFRHLQIMFKYMERERSLKKLIRVKFRTPPLFPDMDNVFIHMLRALQAVHDETREHEGAKGATQAWATYVSNMMYAYENYDLPLFVVNPTVCELALETDLPEFFDISAIERVLGYDCATVLFPKDTFRINDVPVSCAQITTGPDGYVSLFMVAGDLFGDMTERGGGYTCFGLKEAEGGFATRESMQRDLSYELEDDHLKILHALIIADTLATRLQKQGHSAPLVSPSPPCPLRSRTPLRIGWDVVLPATPKGGTHASPHAHWRRGHWRQQRYGQGRQKIKSVWIAPMFVGGAEA